MKEEVPLTESSPNSLKPNLHERPDLYPIFNIPLYSFSIYVLFKKYSAQFIVF
jgi:hypothetical protein